MASADNRGIRTLLSSAGATWATDPADPAHVRTRWPVATALGHLQGRVDVAPLRSLVHRAIEATPGRGPGNRPDPGAPNGG